MKKAKKAIHRTVRVFVAMMVLATILTATPTAVAAYTYGELEVCYVGEHAPNDTKPVPPVKNEGK